MHINCKIDRADSPALGQLTYESLPQAINLGEIIPHYRYSSPPHKQPSDMQSHFYCLQTSIFPHDSENKFKQNIADSGIR
jgi:hypothetical protein